LGIEKPARTVLIGSCIGSLAHSPLHQSDNSMPKLSLLSAATVVLLAGCGTSQPSRTWETVKAVRHTGPGVQNPAAAYAENLHNALQSACVEHKVVTIKFRYRSRLRLNCEGEETAVIYRDSETPAQPWWLMAERLPGPVWLPTQPVESQVAFYLRRPVSIAKIEEFPADATRPAKQASHAGKDGKSVVKPASHPAKSKAGKGKHSVRKSKTSGRKAR
jgi:hypothetical protein